MDEHICPGAVSCVFCAREALERNAHLVEILAKDQMPDCFEPSRPMVVAMAQMYIELRGAVRN